MKDNWDSNKYASIANIQENVSKKLIEQLSLKENDRVLDAGCGVGNITFKVAEIVKGGHVVGIDSSSSMIEKCNESLKTKNISNINFIRKGITEIDFSDEFNVIYSNSVFHWVKEPQKAMDLIFQSLKLGGNIGIQFPLLNAKHPMNVIFNQVVARLNLEEEFKNWEFPWYVPTMEKFKNLIEQYNFEEIKVYTMNTEHNNINSSKLYNSFNSAGLNMFTSILSEEKGKILKQEIKKEIETLKELGKQKISFERLYAFGYHKLTEKN